MVNKKYKYTNASLFVQSKAFRYDSALNWSMFIFASLFFLKFFILA